MEVLVGLLIALIASVAINAAALAISRRGETRGHGVAFASGIAGLCAVPVWLVGGAGLALQFIYASLQSVPGVLFVLGSAAIVLTSVVSLVQIVRLSRRPNNSSKPKPLRGSA